MKVLIGGAGTQCQYTTARNRRANQVCRERRQFIVSRAFTSLKTPNDDPATSGELQQGEMITSLGRCQIAGCQRNAIT